MNSLKFDGIMISVEKILRMLKAKGSWADFTGWIKPYLEELKKLNFSLTNPLFWCFALLLLLLLSKIWGLKKAFSYCLIVSVLLLLTTMLSPRLNIPLDNSDITYSGIFRTIIFFVICVITIYYSIVKND